MYQSNEASRDRKRLREIRQRIELLVQELSKRSPIWKGIVYEHKRRCGKQNCRCMRGELHVCFTFADRSGAKQQNSSLSGSLLQKVKEVTEAYRRFRKARAELTKQVKDIQKIADRLEAYRLKLGLSKIGAKLEHRGGCDG